MILVLKSGMAGKGFAYEPNDVVDWKSNDEAKRLIEKDFAREASPEEIKSAGVKLKTHTPAKPNPAEKWPPQLKKLPKGDNDAA